MLKRHAIKQKELKLQKGPLYIENSLSLHEMMDTHN